MRISPSVFQAFKNRLSSLLFLLLLASAVPVTAQPLSLTPEEQAWLRAHPVIKARISPTYPPFEYYENGSFHGMAYDYVQLIASRLGIRIEPVSGLSWKEALDQIKSRSGVDLVVMITRDKDRESFIEFTNDYISFPEVIFTRKDSRFVSGIKDLYGSTVASENNFIEIDYLKRDIPQVKIIETKTTEEALESVATAKADAYLGNLAVASYLIEKNGLVDLKVAAPSPYPDDSYAMGVRKDWPELARIINKALASMSQEEHRQIRQKWLSLRYEHALRTLDIVKWVSIVAAVLFVFIFQLRRMVRQRTAELQNSLMDLEDANRKMSDIIEFLPDATFVLDSEGRVQAWNRAIEELTGVRKQEMIGKGDKAYAIPFFGEPRSVLADLVMTEGEVKDGQYVSFERSGTTLVAVGFTPNLYGGEGAYISATASPLFDHAVNMVGAIETLRDVTAIKRAEEAIEKLNETLEQRVIERTEELAAANESLAKEIEQRKQAQEEVDWLNEDLMRQKVALEAANRELETFSYTVSHDLRAPLRHISSFSRMIADEHSDQLDSEAMGLFERIVKACSRMDELIEALLKFSSLERQEMRLTSLDTNAVVQEVLTELEPGISDRSVRIDLSDLPQCSGDRTLLKIVFTNLIGNSIKYTAKTADPRIEIGALSKPEESVYFVRDNGAGFDMAYADKLFGVFQRLHGKEFDGTGIGLATVQRIIQRHGGRIWAESEPGKGAAFYFTLKA